MAFTQLDPPIPVQVIGKGKAMAIAVIDYGPEHNLIWVSAIDETGEIWCAPNPVVRMQANWTLGRPRPDLGVQSACECESELSDRQPAH
ncbi:MAG: hypothetical protein ABIU18_06090 [Novosphingobium sp.]